MRIMLLKEESEGNLMSRGQLLWTLLRWYRMQRKFVKTYLKEVGRRMGLQRDRHRQLQRRRIACLLAARWLLIKSVRPPRIPQLQTVLLQGCPTKQFLLRSSRTNSLSQQWLPSRKDLKPTAIKKLPIMPNA